jgi:phenylacetate-CoA ligase
MEDAWGAKVYDHAGATEIGAWSFECTEQPGGMHINDAFFLVEIEDIETGQSIDEPGRQGTLVITAFDRQAMPCIRFDSKDIAEWAAEPCPCGRSFRVIKGGIVGRTDDITKVKGVLLAPTAIEEVVRGIDGLGAEYEVVVSKAGDADRITLKVELVPQAKLQREPLEAMLKDRLRLRTNLRYDLEFHEYGTLPRYPVKARRFKDLRKNL